MSNWRVATSLVILNREINAAAPRRSKKSDGTIGDPAHAARDSDHNPNGSGVVCARDITHDPAHGADMNRLARFLLLYRHPSLKYLIWNKRIVSAKTDWQWAPYKGTNPHTHHLHVSVKPGKDDYDSGLAWGAALAWREPVAVKLGTQHPDVAFLQRVLGVRASGRADALTISALKRYQLRHKLASDGIAGRRTWATIL